MLARRFRQERQILAGLNHPGIAALLDAGVTPEGRPFLVMEYVDGTDVQRMIAREGRLPAEHALAVTAHLCDALAYAHKNGIVHRDIKPSNVLIDAEGRVKVADFGLAKLTTSNPNSGLTQTGMAMGTPDYLAPETLTLGSDVDGRADLYAVGVMLYQMLTGDIPRGVFRMPSQKFRNIDPRFDAIVQRALEHDREERYQSSIEIRRDLDVILTTPYAAPGQEVASAAVPKQPAGRTVIPSGRQRQPGAAAQRQASSRAAAPPPPHPASSSNASSLIYVIAAFVFLGIGIWFVMPKTTHVPSDSSSPPSPAPSGTGVAPNPFDSASLGSSPTPAAPPNFTLPSSSTPTPASTTTNAPSPTPPKVSPPAPQPPVPTLTTPNESISDRLATLESQFQSAFEREVNAAYADQITTLGAAYITALERGVSAATSGRRLDEAIALRDEKTRFTTHKFMPSIDPAGLHRSVVQLRNTYRATEKTYSQQKDASSLPLYDRYIVLLTALEKDLITQGRVSDATRVRVKRDDVVARRKQRAAKAST